MIRVFLNIKMNDETGKKLLLEVQESIKLAPHKLKDKAKSNQ